MPDAKVGDAVARMRRQGVGAVVITTDKGGVVGMISERDVLRGLADQGPAVLDRTVGALMTSNPVTCKPEDRANAVMAMMSNRRIRHVPVVVDGKLAGIGGTVKKRLDQVQMEAGAMRDFIATA